MHTNGRALLELFFPIAEGLAKMFGERCEVVLHDLSHPESSIIYIVNGSISGRKIGDGIRDLLWDVIRSPDFNENVLANYTSTRTSGKKIKSTTVIIRNPEGKIVGALCINFDITGMDAVGEFLEKFLDVQAIVPPENMIVKIEKSNVLDILEHIIDKTIADNYPNDGWSREKMIYVIGFLEKKGAFLIKGAVEWVAAKLGISRFTVYSYLKEVRVENRLNEKAGEKE